MTTDEPQDKIVLVITYTKIQDDHEEQDVAVIVSALQDSVDELEVWVQDEEHDEETAYGFDVTHTEVVDADVAEVGLP